MPIIETDTRRAFRELIDLLDEVDRRWVSEEWNLFGPDDVVGAHRAVMHLLEGGIAGMFECDPASPEFRRIIEPWRKFTGDNADAIYFDAPVSSDHVYRVRGERGGAVYVSVTVEEPIMLPDSSVSRLGAGDGYLNQLGGVLMLGSQSSFYFRRLIAVLHVDSKSRFDSLVADKTIIREIEELLRLYTRTSAPTRIMLSCARKYLVPPRLPSRDHPGFRLGRTTVLDPHRKPDEIIETELLSPVT